MVVGEIEKGLPVAVGDGVRAGVIIETEVARDQRCVHRRKFARAQILFAEQTIDRTGGHLREKFPARVGPLVPPCRR